MELDSRVAFTALVALVAILRLVELRISARNVTALMARGGFEIGARHYPFMVLVHASFLAGCVLEVWLLDRPWLPALGAPMLGLLAVGTGLRYWAIRTLGPRWSTRIIVVPGEPLVTGGPFRWLRHPNYLGVVLELLALPLVHSAWLTAMVAAVANALVLRRRVVAESAALR